MNVPAEQLRKYDQGVNEREGPETIGWEKEAESPRQEGFMHTASSEMHVGVVWVNGWTGCHADGFVGDVISLSRSRTEIESARCPSM
ncbi:hypothetical protein Tcan_06015 [Toxocara canis]|uniref:Uncharacterized protein n=1 Tax=Toxocara canis TaxID=6265 RepID=A0A0B2V644_TOXCA|nr:hypothetical protein Tcan_06015 [Toxocara canis]